MRIRASWIRELKSSRKKCRYIGAWSTPAMVKIKGWFVLVLRAKQDPAHAAWEYARMTPGTEELQHFVDFESDIYHFEGFVRPQAHHDDMNPPQIAGEAASSSEQHLPSFALLPGLEGHRHDYATRLQIAIETLPSFTTSDRQALLESALALFSRNSPDQ
ncbi:hypothetical protein Q5752_007121 [Cryptotrichosporon argae]